MPINVIGLSEDRGRHCALFQPAPMRTLNTYLLFLLSSILYCFANGITRTKASRAKLEESFDEDLVLRPLRDGRVLSRFAFTTLLHGAEPRDPSTLEEEDRRK
jgi:hypothetical protein